MKSVIVGTAGHIDHGKSTLVEALTGTHPDRLAEEKRRGITIDLGFAFLEESGVRFGFIDVPGHERFVSNMLAGAAGIDVLLLVIAADESIKPQTREHFDICRLLGVKRGVVALTKSDGSERENRSGTRRAEESIERRGSKRVCERCRAIFSPADRSRVCDERVWICGNRHAHFRKRWPGR